MAAAAAVGGHAQTTVNNSTVNNTTINNNVTNVIVQRPTVVFNNPIPRPPPEPYRPPVPSAFPYQPRDLLPYMSSRCAELYELQLNGFSHRTGNMSSASSVNEEFRRDCPDSMAEARKNLYEAQLRKYLATQDQKAAVKTAVAQGRATEEQCNEMLRILAGKRKRAATMDKFEKEDQARFEDTYAARCKRGG